MNVPPPYTYANMHANSYGASAAHVPAPYPCEAKPDIFNVWGISGYTGSIDTSTSLNPEQTASHLAKIQQAMTGHNQFDPFKFSQPDTLAKDKDKDSNDGDDSDIPRPPTPASPDNKKHQGFTFSGYAPAYPGYGYNYGLAPPPCPPKKKNDKKGNKCKGCEGASGHPVKKIKKLNGKTLCWACVWRAYAQAAEEVWEESEDVKSDDE